jgi:hypothetical protein
MVANGADGNIRGQMVVPGDGTGSAVHPGADHYLTYKGVDTAERVPVLPRPGRRRRLRRARQPERRDLVLRLEDEERLRPGRASVAADYINQRDLNLLRRMVATRSSSGGIAFYVCNAPGTRQQVADRDRPRVEEKGSTTRTRSRAWRWNTRRSRAPTAASR